MKHNLYIFHTNRVDLTLQAYNSVKDYFNVTLIDNSETHELFYTGLDAHIYYPPISFTFQQSQNLILKWSKDRGDAFYFWMHNDAVALEDTSQRLIEFVENLDTPWGAVFTNYDTFCAFNTRALTAVRGWDWFEQYFADNHMYRKLRLAGYPTLDTGFPVLHQNDASNTIKADSERAFKNSVTFPFYLELYRRCWGGEPGSERFNSPFNR